MFICSIRINAFIQTSTLCISASGLPLSPSFFNNTLGVCSILWWRSEYQTICICPKHYEMYYRHDLAAEERTAWSKCILKENFFCLLTEGFPHGVRLSPLGTAATVWPIVPAPDDDDDCEVIRIQIGRGNGSTLRENLPLCPPQIPHDLTQARTQAAAVGSWWLTTWVMAWP
jgi:hypothetical protein